MKDDHFFDKPQNVKRVLMGFYIFLILVIVVDLILPKHPFFTWDGYPFFYASFGFVAFVFLIFAAKYILRPIVKRKEDYYDE